MRITILRKLEVAAVLAQSLPPHPATVVSCGRGVEAFVLAILDGSHALYKVGPRLEERGLLPLLWAGLQRESLHDYRLGQMLDALCAANLKQVCNASRSRRMPSRRCGPSRYDDDDPMGAYEDLPAPQRQEAAKEAAPVAPCPTHGYNKDGHLELKQVSLHLGVSGDSGLPRRLGRRAGHTSDSTETSVTIEAWPQSRLLLAPRRRRLGVCWQPARPPSRCALARLGSGARGAGRLGTPGRAYQQGVRRWACGRPQHEREGGQGAWYGWVHAAGEKAFEIPILLPSGTSPAGKDRHTE